MGRSRPGRRDYGTTRGGQSRCSGPAIATALTLRAVVRLALHRTEGLIGSIIVLPGLNPAVPDHMALQAMSGYNCRVLVGADISRLTRVSGNALRFRTDGRRATDAAIAVGVLNRMMNRMLNLGRPEYVRTA